MKLPSVSFTEILSLLRIQKKSQRANVFGSDYKQAMLIKQGREQFKSLVKKGLGIPVVFL